MIPQEIKVIEFDDNTVDWGLLITKTAEVNIPAGDHVFTAAYVRKSNSSYTTPANSNQGLAGTVVGLVFGIAAIAEDLATPDTTTDITVSCYFAPNTKYLLKAVRQKGGKADIQVVQQK
jgi:hypothetical protein